MAANSFTVPLGVKAMIAAALPQADVAGLEGDGEEPERIGPDGRVVVFRGDPGDPEITMSPLTYGYMHAIPVDFTAGATGDQTAAEVVATMIGAVADAILADRELGGLVDFLDAGAPLTDDDYRAGAASMCTASATIVATYSTTRPL